jgi:hypothetical protein
LLFFYFYSPITSIYFSFPIIFLQLPMKDV